MIINAPDSAQIPALRRLWQQAFGDSEQFLDIFFETAYSPDRCRCVIVDDQLAAALYWFDCRLDSHRYAYLYAVATDSAYQNRGLCKALLDNTHRHLFELGYAGTVLVPGEASLFQFYKQAGYRMFGFVDEFSYSAASSPVSLRVIDSKTYADLRKDLLPAGGLLQDGETLAFLRRFSQFYAGDGFLLAATLENQTLTVHEYLGDPALAPAIVAALRAESGRFRSPGKGKPFAMFYPLVSNAPVPTYLGLALD